MLEHVKPKVKYIKVLTGYKKDGTKIIYKLFVYDFYDDLKIQKKTETIERKIIKILSNQKLFDSFDCDIINIDEKKEKGENNNGNIKD